MSIETKIGEKIKKRRLEKGILLKDIANRSGISSSMLCQIEKGKANPSLNTLKILANVLEMPIFEFFTETRLNEVEINIVKNKDRKIIVTKDIIYELISPEGTQTIECMKMIFTKKNSESSIEPIPHKGEEVAFILSGKVELTMGNKKIEMEEGDSVQIPPTIPHKWKNLFKGESVVIFSVTPLGF